MSPRQDPAIIDDERVFAVHPAPPPRFWSIDTACTVVVVFILVLAFIWSC